MTEQQSSEPVQNARSVWSQQAYLRLYRLVRDLQYFRIIKRRMLPSGSLVV